MHSAWDATFQAKVMNAPLLANGVELTAKWLQPETSGLPDEL